MKNHSGQLRLKNLVFWGRHGHLPFEREAGNRFEVDIELRVDVSDAVAADRLEATVDLREAYQIAQHHVEGEPCELIETVAQRIAADLAALSGVQSSTVRVRKIFPPLPGAIQGVMEAEVTHGR